MAASGIPGSRAGRRTLRRVGSSTLVVAAIGVLLARNRCSRPSPRPSGDDPWVSSLQQMRSSEGDKTDQAALMGAAVAAVLALVLGPGAWDLPASVFGVALILLLRGYFRVTPPSAPELRETEFGDLVRRARRKGFALAAVAGLCAGLALAYPLQLLAKIPPVDGFAKRQCDLEGRVQESWSKLVLRDAGVPEGRAKEILRDERDGTLAECVSGGSPATASPWCGS